MPPMSAQVITALRVRAEVLDGEADRSAARGSDEAPGRTEPALRMLAAEFRALARAAEGFGDGT
jgi:hypothetical protein